MFGLDLKSVVVGILLGVFVLPWIMGLVSRPMAPKSAA